MLVPQVLPCIATPVDRDRDLYLVMLVGPYEPRWGWDSRGWPKIGDRDFYDSLMRRANAGQISPLYFVGNVRCHGFMVCERVSRQWRFGHWRRTRGWCGDSE